MLFSVYRVSSIRPTSGGLYVHDSEHPYICTDINVDAELAKGGGWIYPADHHEHDKSRVGGSCIPSTLCTLLISSVYDRLPITWGVRAGIIM